MSTFELDKKLAADSIFIADLGLTQLRLMNDTRYPWLLLVPKRTGVSEIHDLSPLDQTMLTFEISEISKALADLTGATKINVGALGNIVRQLHVHVIARFEGDAAWPGPVWGVGQAVPYGEGEASAFISKLSEKF